MKRFRSLVLAVALVAAAAPTAGAQLPFRIDFNALSSPESQFDIQSTSAVPDPRLINNGVGVFTLSSSATQGFGTYGSAPSDPYYDNYTGSAALFANLTSTQINVGALSGGAFSLTSVDVAPLFAPSFLGLTSIPTFQLDFFGRALGSSSFFSQRFTVPASTGRPTYTTLTFDSRFTNLAQVAWFNRGVVAGQTCTLDECTHQFDNVVGVLATPEPSSLVLATTGLLTLAGVAYRRRRSRSA